MIPTVENVKDRVRVLLNDTQVVGGEIYTDAMLQQFLAPAVEEIYAEMLKEQLPYIEKIATYTLPASTTALAPDDFGDEAGISDFGELIELEERTAGSTDKYYPVVEVDELDQYAPAEALREFCWREDKFNFIGATTDRDLRLRYYTSGTAPATGSLGIDGCLNFLAHATAHKAGSIKGADPALLSRLRLAAYGGMDENGRSVAGYLDDLIAPMVREKHHIPIRPRRYRAGYRPRLYW